MVRNLLIGEFEHTMLQVEPMRPASDDLIPG